MIEHGEEIFLLNCLKVWLEKEQPEILEDTSNIKDWQRFIHLIGITKTGAVLYKLFSKYRQDINVPKQVSEHCATIYKQVAAYDLLREAALIYFAKAFKSAGIKLVLFKGAAHAYAIYPDSCLRFGADVDIFIADADRQKVNQLLIDEGYLLDTTKQISRGVHCEDQFYKPNSISLDVHTDIVGMGKGKYCFDTKGMLERAQPITHFEKRNAPVYCFAPEDELTVLSANAVKDWAIDFSTVFDTWLFLDGQKANLELVAERVKASRLKGALWFLFLFVKKWFGAQAISDEVIDLLRPKQAKLIEPLIEFYSFEESFKKIPFGRTTTGRHLRRFLLQVITADTLQEMFYFPKKYYLYRVFEAIQKRKYEN